MPHYDEEYKGSQISIDTVECKGGYGWSYQTGGGELRELRGRPQPTEDLARKEALRTAQAEIDARGT